MPTFTLPVFEIATRSADPNLFKITFGVDRDQFAAELEQYLENSGLLTAISIAVSWEVHSIEVDGAVVWRATKFIHCEEGTCLGAIPASIEAYLIVQCLLAHAGDDVILIPGLLAISGGLALKGEFISKPSVDVREAESENPIDDVIAIYHAAQVGHYQIMTGFAMSEDGCWEPGTWLVLADGTVIDIEEPHTHYYGVRLSTDAAAAFVESFSD